MKAILPALEAAGFMTFIFLVIYTPNLRAWHARQVECKHLERQLYPGPPTTRWPDICADPPCDHEDRWVCTTHQARGRHHAVWQGSLDDQPADIILAVVTEVQNRKKP